MPFALALLHHRRDHQDRHQQVGEDRQSRRRLHERHWRFGRKDRRWHLAVLFRQQEAGQAAALLEWQKARRVPEPILRPSQQRFFLRSGDKPLDAEAPVLATTRTQIMPKIEPLDRLHPSQPRSSPLSVCKRQGAEALALEKAQIQIALVAKPPQSEQLAVPMEP